VTPVKAPTQPALRNVARRRGSPSRGGNIRRSATLPAIRPAFATPWAAAATPGFCMRSTPTTEVAAPSSADPVTATKP
jgi:hypothetical protein